MAVTDFPKDTTSYRDYKTCKHELIVLLYTLDICSEIGIKGETLTEKWRGIQVKHINKPKDHMEIWYVSTLTEVFFLRSPPPPPRVISGIVPIPQRSLSIRREEIYVNTSKDGTLPFFLTFVIVSPFQVFLLYSYFRVIWCFSFPQGINTYWFIIIIKAANVDVL